MFVCACVAQSFDLRGLILTATVGSGDDQTCLVLDLIHYRNCLASNTDLATKIFKVRISVAYG